MLPTAAVVPQSRPHGDFLAGGDFSAHDQVAAVGSDFEFVDLRVHLDESVERGVVEGGGESEPDRAAAASERGAGAHEPQGAVPAQFVSGLVAHRHHGRSK